VAEEHLTAKHIAEASAGKDLVVFDYDGTLAYLGVDWEAVRESLSGIALRFGFESSFRPLWVEMATAREIGGSSALEQLFQALAEHERLAVATQEPRTEIVNQARSILEDDAGPECAIFSVNLHETVTTGLEALRLGSMRHIVGADNVTQWKPDPEGLNVLMNEAKTMPERTLFVGDSKGDQEAAASAGVEFVWA
jgi:phosphoglycolate phosphatase-like HAD superfamily hydrolase